MWSFFLKSSTYLKCFFSSWFSAVCVISSLYMVCLEGAACISAPILPPLTTITWYNNPYRVIVCVFVAIVVPVGGLVRWINACIFFSFFFFSNPGNVSEPTTASFSPILPHTHTPTLSRKYTPAPTPVPLQAYLWGPPTPRLPECDELRPSLARPVVLSISISTPAESQGNYAPFPGM